MESFFLYNNFVSLCFLYSSILFVLLIKLLIRHKMKLIFRLCFQLVLILLSLAGSIYFLYIPVTDGVLHLKRAKSESVLMRQAPHGIQHVRADSLEMALYT